MTKQEAYNRINSYFSMPTAEFGWGEDQCVYLDRDSRARCAVGVLIPEKEAFDELAMMSMGSVSDLRETLLYHRGENGSRPDLRRAAARLYDTLSFDDPEFIAFLEGCQRIHDKHGEAFNTQFVSNRYFYDSTADEERSSGFRPIINQGLAEAKRVMLAELRAFALENDLEVA